MKRTTTIEEQKNWGSFLETEMVETNLDWVNNNEVKVDPLAIFKKYTDQTEERQRTMKEKLAIFQSF